MAKTTPALSQQGEENLKNLGIILAAVFCGAGFVQFLGEFLYLDPPGYFAFYVTAGAAALIYLIATFRVVVQSWRVFDDHHPALRSIISLGVAIVWPVIFAKTWYEDYRLLRRD